MVNDLTGIKAILPLLVLTGLIIGCGDATDDSNTPTSHLQQDSGTADKIPLKAEQAGGSAEDYPALAKAITAGDVDRVKKLLEKGADVNCRDRYGRTPLHEAAWAGNLEIVKLLYENGADLDAVDDGRAPPLHDALFQGHWKVSRFLMEKECDVNTTDNLEQTALHWAAWHWRNSLRITWLVQKGLDINAVDKEGRTPLDIALLNPHGYFITCEIIENGGRAGTTVPQSLPQAAMLGDIEKVKDLLRADENVNEIDSQSMSALQYAAKFGYEEIAGFLLQNGADADRDSIERTPLSLAAEGGHFDTVRTLLSHGADINRPRDWSNPLQMAVRRGSIEIAEYLIANGADINVTNHRGETALDEAHTKEMRRLLIAHGAVPGERE